MPGAFSITVVRYSGGSTPFPGHTGFCNSGCQVGLREYLARRQSSFSLFAFVTWNGGNCNAFYMGNSFKPLKICRWNRTFQPTSLAAFHAESSLFWPFKWLFKWFGTHLGKKQPVSFCVSFTAEVTWGTSAKSPFLVIKEQEEADGKVLSVWSPWLWTKFYYYFAGISQKLDLTKSRNIKCPGKWRDTGEIS